MMKKILLSTFCLLALMACNRAKVPDPAIAQCPEKQVGLIQKNQRFLESAVAGETSAKGLRDLSGLRRKATLEKAGEDPLLVAFYLTALPGCPWLVYRETLTPVVIKDGTILAVGSEQVKAMTAHGWALKEAKWPWQRYDFGYLPFN